MKNLLACLAILAAFHVTAQTETSNFPYNPDSDGDGLIGVSDLVNLLGFYESQFNVSAQLNSDSTSAIYYPPEWYSEGMYRSECAALCDTLPGPWHIMTYQGFTQHGPQILADMPSGSLPIHQYDWENMHMGDDDGEVPVHDFFKESSSGTFRASYMSYNAPYVACLCELRQRPRVEYDFCEGDMTQVQSCAAGKVSEGWYPLELTSAGSNTFVQTFWRWED